MNGSKAVVLATAFAATFACKKDPTVVTRTVTAHVSAACATPADAFARYVGSGDFDPSVQAYGVLADEATSLDALPQSSQSVFVDVTDGDSSDAEWWGSSPVAASGDVDVLLWPATSPCALTTDVRPRTEAALGLTGDGRLLIAGGELPPSSSGGVTPPTFVADLGTGTVTALANGLLTPRRHPTITPFGAGALIAGGVKSDGTALGSAEVFTGTDIDRTAIGLSAARADHAAVVLASGETLLVGGTDGFSPDNVPLETVDPTSRIPRTSGLAQLIVPRTKPNVVKLASGDILAAGGLDATGNPVPTLEWLAPDARSHTLPPQVMPARRRSALVALAAGGALAVLLPDPSDTVPFDDVWVIGADGIPLAAPRLSIAPTDSGAPLLFGSAEGRPILWTGDRWLQWEPWSATFDALPSSASTGPVDEAISGDPALALWLDHGPTSVHLTGLRFSRRGAFDSIQVSLLRNDTTLVAPDRLVAPPFGFAPDPGLTLPPGASVFVTDTTYAGVTIDIDVPTNQPPLVVLRDAVGEEYEIGGAACPFPAAAQTLHIVRSGASIVVNANPACSAPAALSRVSVGLRGVAPASVARNLRIAR